MDFDGKSPAICGQQLVAVVQQGFPALLFTTGWAISIDPRGCVPTRAGNHYFFGVPNILVVFAYFGCHPCFDNI